MPPRTRRTLGHQESTVEVGRQQRTPLVVGHVFETFHRLRRSIVDDHAGPGLGVHGVDGGFISKIRLDDSRSTKTAGKVCRSRFIAMEVHDDTRAGFGESFGDALPDIAAGSGHKHRLAVKIEQLLHGPVLSIVHAVLRGMIRGIVH